MQVYDDRLMFRVDTDMHRFEQTLSFDQIVELDVYRQAQPGAGLTLTFYMKDTTIVHLFQFPVGCGSIDKPQVLVDIQQTSSRCLIDILQETIETQNTKSVNEIFDQLCELPQIAGTSLFDSMCR